MPTLLLLRHGRTTANASGLLAGRTPGVALDDYGAAQAAALPARLAGIPLAAAVHSPLQRCAETLAPLLAERPGLPAHVEERVVECDYGAWTNRPLKELAEEPLMAVVRSQPSAAVFPGGESLRAMHARVTEAVRDWDERIAAEHGQDAIWLMCTHGDNIKAIVADALGLHLDLFQRFHPRPASVTALHYGRPPALLRFGDTGDLAEFVPRTEAAARDAGEAERAPVGGGA
ncbi:MSMEG_4193 family putative phosphomutase [Streptomyces sp. DSM 44917]|uniref:MSMEG_4193 family putative phosphomutase n=1 Tax=Streptomyces boetiae TaxID=3075541 RepID=A0ABU2L2Z9_9ACTN|nr:MSMEG_4193 family putative phosphomutase [Streptomyces sp. DSM 44917]MDT0305942.1 MSMEG_4193 family putative phosphomutase [Streptomyces sp. DSM 44917]